MGLVDNNDNNNNDNKSGYDTYQSCLLKTIKKLKNHILTSSSNSTSSSIGMATMSFGETSLEDDLMHVMRENEINISNLKISE